MIALCCIVCLILKAPEIQMHHEKAAFHFHLFNFHSGSGESISTRSKKYVSSILQAENAILEC